MAITLYQFAASPFCDKIRRVLRYKQLAFDLHEWPVAEVPAIRDKNPIGKLPVLDLDGTVVVDSTTIALEVERRFPSPPLLPADPVLRAQVFVLEDWADESLYFYEMSTRFAGDDFDRNVWKLLPGVPKEMHPAIAPMLREAVAGTAAAQGTGRKPTELLEADLVRLLDAVQSLQARTGFAVGETLTLADIAIAAQVECIGDAALGERLFAARPGLVAYLHRVDELTHADRV